MKKLLVIDGPNMNFLGIRDKTVYGKLTYADLCAYISEKALPLGFEPVFFQSNHEGAIIDRIQEAYTDKTEAIIINPAAFTHYSIAIRDALDSVPMPKVEVHLSDIYKREDFRKISVTKDVCNEQICGFGFDSYIKGMEFLKKYLEKC